MTGRAVIFITIFILFMLPACVSAPTVAPTSMPISTQTALPTIAPTSTTIEADLSIKSDGRDRSYHLFRPGTLDASKPVPLVIFLHYSGSSGSAAFSMYGLNQEAERGRFMVVYPDAVGRDHQWNAGICCGDAVTEKVDDVAFINRLIERLSSDYRVDPARIYVWGVSNGGMMAYRVACELSSRIAAIASSAGPLVVEQCQATSAVSVVHFHSIMDEYWPYAGGKHPGPPEFVQMPVVAMIERWRELDGCSRTPVVEQIGSATKTSSKECRGHTEVTLFTANEGSHTYPLGYSANITRMVVDFFTAHQKSP